MTFDTQNQVVNVSVGHNLPEERYIGGAVVSNNSQGNRLLYVQGSIYFEDTGYGAYRSTIYISNCLSFCNTPSPTEANHTTDIPSSIPT